MTFSPERQEGPTSSEAHDDPLETSPAAVAMVFAGGLGLAAHHAGVIEASRRAQEFPRILPRAVGDR